MYSTLFSGSPSFLQSPAVSCKRSSFLPVNANLAPQRESSTAHAHPMPLLAPENRIYLWRTSQGLRTRFTFCFIRVRYRSVMPISFKVTLPRKRKGRQDDCHARHWRCWKQASTSPVTTSAVILTTFPFLWLTLGQSYDDPIVNEIIPKNTDEWINHVYFLKTYIRYNNGSIKTDRVWHILRDMLYVS